MHPLLFDFFCVSRQKRSCSASAPLSPLWQSAPGPPGPYTIDLARAAATKRFPGASPTSAGKLSSLRKQLFNKPAPKWSSREATRTRCHQLALWPPDMHWNLPRLTRRWLLQLLRILPKTEFHGLYEAIRPRVPLQPDLQGVVTQQTAILQQKARLNGQPLPRNRTSSLTRLSTGIFSQSWHRLSCSLWRQGPIDRRWSLARLSFLQKCDLHNTIYLFYRWQLCVRPSTMRTGNASPNV